MKVGFALPHQGPVATRDNMRLVATEAELMGYDSLWTNERLLVPVNAKTPYPGNAEGVLDEEYKTHLDHLTCMTYVSAITERVRRCERDQHPLVQPGPARQAAGSDGCAEQWPHHRGRRARLVRGRVRRCEHPLP